MISTTGSGANKKTCYRCDYCHKVLDSDNMVTLADPGGSESVHRELHFCNHSQASKWIVAKYNLKLFG